MGVSGILLVAAFLLTLIASLWGGPGAPAPYVRFPHFGWLGVSLYFLLLVLGGR
jgi:hypothetical protein